MFYEHTLTGLDVVHHTLTAIYNTDMKNNIPLINTFDLKNKKIFNQTKRRRTFWFLFVFCHCELHMSGRTAADDRLFLSCLTHIIVYLLLVVYLLVIIKQFISH